MESRVKKKKTKIRWKRIVLIAFFGLFIVGGIFAYNVYGNVANAVEKMSTSIDREKSEKRVDDVEVAEKDPISILLVGVDERDDDAGRTDSMLVMTLNPEDKSTKIISIPRDTRADLIDPEDSDDDKVSKMNHAYAYGGIEMTMSSIENFLNIPLDYYVQVNMEGFKDIVDSVGGIDVVNKYEFELDGTYLEEGPQHLDGEEALQYARMRKEDPTGDFGRQGRQQEVITKVIEKGLTFSSISKYDEILDVLADNIETDFSLKEMTSTLQSYRAAAETIKKMEIEGKGETIDGTWYWIVSDKTRQALSDELRTHLGLETDTVTASTESDEYEEYVSSKSSDYN
jgi:polyisoprenyl-teichoic acid--peptidoglycan teichoic acid transferase